MNPKKLNKEMQRIVKKNPKRCSICKEPFKAGAVYYTCFGYDRLGRFQVTSGCCHEQLERILQLGVFGPVDPDESIKKHPLYTSFVGDFSRKDVISVDGNEKK
jgi:hypothetical protein